MTINAFSPPGPEPKHPRAPSTSTAMNQGLKSPSVPPRHSATESPDLGYPGGFHGRWWLRFFVWTGCGLLDLLLIVAAIWWLSL